MRSITVVGASLAGLSTVRALRAEGYDGGIVVIGEERHTPYDRPPLSKDFLKGDLDAAALALGDADEYEALDVEWLLGERAMRLDPAAQCVVLAGGRQLRSDGVVVATGASPRTLPGTDGLAGVHTLRTLDDAHALRAELLDGLPRIVVIGAGFIGAEVASTAHALGLHVTVVEALERTAGTPTGARDGAGVLLAPQRSRGPPAVRNRSGGTRRRGPGDRRTAGGRDECCPPTSSWSAWASGPPPTGSPVPACRWTTAWCATPAARPASRAWSPSVTSPAAPARSPDGTPASSTGAAPPSRRGPPPARCSPECRPRHRSPRRTSGPTSTRCASSSPDMSPPAPSPKSSKVTSTAAPSRPSTGARAPPSPCSRSTSRSSSTGSAAPSSPPPRSHVS